MAKKLGCLLLIVVLVLVVLLGAAFGVAYWGYGKYVEPSLGVGFFDALGLVVGMYKYDSDEIVTNPYDPEADLAAFNLSFRQAFVPDAVLDEYGIDIDELNEKFDLEKILTGDWRESFDTSKIDEDYISGFLKPGESIDDYVDEIPIVYLEKKKVALDGGLDIPELPDNIPVSVPDYIEVTDKQVAALMQSYLEKYASEYANVKNLASTLHGVDATKLLRVMQVSILDSGEIDKTTLAFSVTFRADFLLLFDALAPDGVPDFVKKLIPKEVFLTLTLYPGDPLKAGTMTANSFDDKQNKTLKTMFDSIAKDSGGFDSLMVRFNATVSELLGTIESNNFIPVKFVKSA